MGATAIALAAGKGALGAASSIATGIQKDRAARANAEALEKDAELSIRASRFKARQERIVGDEVISSGTAITGASGTKINRGSDLRVREVNQGRLETSITEILFSGKLAAHRLRTGADSLRAQGKAAKVAGFIGGVQSILGAVSSGASIAGNLSTAAKLKSSSGISDPSLGTASLRGEA